MSIPARRRATYEDVMRAPRHKLAEVLGGELHLSPRPAGRHARAASRLGSVLGGPFDWGRDGPGGWVLLDEPELHLGEEILVPDLAGWRTTRLPSLDVPFFTVAPDWVCEVLSPSTARIDRVDKLPAYAHADVSHAWLIDPILRTLEVLALSGASWRIEATYKDDSRVRAVPFDAIELDLSLLWADVSASSARE